MPSTTTIHRSWERDVDSSFVERVGFARASYDDGRETTLALVTIRGRRYVYEAPPWTVGLLLAADATGRSVGRVFNRVLRSRFAEVAAFDAAA